MLNPGGIISTAAENFRHVETYSVTLNSTAGGAGVIRYFYRKPGFVRMEFIDPHRGAVLVYNPLKKEARLRPFGILKALAFNLSPDNKLITSSKGHTVDESDIGALFRNVLKVEANGKAGVDGEEMVGRRQAIRVKVAAAGGFISAGVNSYTLWLEKGSLMPLKVSAFDAGGALFEEVLMDDLAVNPGLPDDIFELE